MVTQIIGNYLVSKDLITSEQFADLMATQQRVRVKLGLIAVAEGLMSQEEANNINRLQAIKDMRFGDIAVEKGYLTDGQVRMLLEKQGNAYLVFAQSLENVGLMSIEQLGQYMEDYARENNMSAAAMEDLKSDDVSRILPYYFPADANAYIDIAGVAVRMLRRCVDADVYPKKAYFAGSYAISNGAAQHVGGDKEFSCALVGNGNELLYVASTFCEEEFDSMNEDALDSIGELLNCINGLYASALSQSGVILELLPPDYSDNYTEISGKEMLILPLVINGQDIHLAVTIGSHLTIK